MIRIAIIFALVFITGVVGIYLPTFQALDFFAILLSVIAGLYVGFAFADGRVDKIVIELVFALLMCAGVLFGMWKWPWLIPAGYLLLGGWGVLHHFFDLGTRVRDWFASMSAIYCVFIGLLIHVQFFYLH